jgi:hypothetical protein
VSGHKPWSQIRRKRSLVDEILRERREEQKRENECVCAEINMRHCPVHSLSDEEVLAMWRRGELTVKTGRIVHGNLCVCPEKGDGEWCDKCEGYALEQGE